MPVQVVPNGFVDSNGISQSQLAAMWDSFHQAPGGGTGSSGNTQPTTRYAHFPLRNILELLLVNKIVDSSTTMQQALDVKNFAIRVFFAQHVDKNDCPVGADEDYIGRNTVVLVNARKVDDKNWENMISDNPDDPNSVELTGFQIGPSFGSDRTNLCPPQCT